MDEVLVVKAVKPNYNTLSGGPPIMMVGGGGGGGRGGTTMRQRAGSLAGGLVGVAGALAGQHRSLGSLAQSMISGGAQGAALGGGLGRRLVGRRGQARADLREASRQQRAEDKARDAEELRNRGQGIGSMASLANKRPRLAAVLNPAASIRRRNYEAGRQEDEKADLVRVRNQAADSARGAMGDEYRRQGNEMRRRNQSREEAIAREAGAGYGREMREGYGIYSDLRDHGMVAGDITSQQFDNAMRAFNAREPIEPVRVDPSTQGSGSVVPVLASGQPVPPQLMLPPPMNAPSGGANDEITQIENASEKEALQTGTNHTGEYGSRIKSLSQAMNEDENEEEEDPSQQVLVQNNQPPPQGNQQLSTLDAAVRRDAQQGM